MTLATHAVVGAAIASSIPHHPILGFTLAFASHFVLDAIPHWDYPLSSSKTDDENRMNDDMVMDKTFYFDLSRIALDMSCGVLLALAFFSLSSPYLFWVPIVGVCGATLPDALQFVYWKWRHQPLIALQRFHLWIHSKVNFNERPIIGVPFQIVVIILTIAAAKLL